MKPSVLLLCCVSLLSLCAHRAACAQLQAPSPSPPSAVHSPTSVIGSTGYTAEAEADRVEELPGFGKPSAPLFAGYVTVDDQAGRALFYAFAESEQNVSAAPLVLWLNGGPGCSSIGGGFLSELGPYFPTTAGDKLTANTKNWNQIASVVFLESPAFVGFSYSNTTTDVATGDRRTADDSLSFMLGFLAKFPQYIGRPMYITGESYGGHYIPNLSLTILKFNDQTNNSPINLVGMLIGNPWTSPLEDNKGVVDFWYSHALISTDTHQSILQSCNLTNIGPLSASPTKLAAVEDALDPLRCNHALDTSSQEMGNINVYSIYSDVCVGLPASTFNSARYAKLAAVEASMPLTLGRTSVAEQVQKRIKARLADTSTLAPVPQYDPCVDNNVASYLNRPDVQKALHANTTGTVAGPWADCADAVTSTYSQDDLYSSMIPVHKELIARKFRVGIYSGDTDTVCSFLGTRTWIEALQLPLLRSWRPWYSTTGQVGGYVVNYQGLVYATVRNAGHMVPYTQPERAYYLFSKFLEASSQDLELFLTS